MKLTHALPLKSQVAAATIGAVALTYCGISTAQAAPAPALDSLLVNSRTVAMPATTQVIEVVDASGQVVGYTVDAATRAALDAVSRQIALSGDRSVALGGAAELDASVWDVAKCVAAISAFIAFTVFPTARAAKLAVRLAQLVNKYGVKKMAQILTRTYKGSDVNAQAIWKEIALAATGIGTLSVCF